MAALARALQLTDAERDHLHRLAGLAVPAGAEISDRIPPGMRRILNRLGDAAAAVFAADWQLIWWNRSWAGLLGDPSVVPAEQRNFARDTFPARGASPRLAHWPVTSLSQRDVEASVVLTDGDAERKIVVLAPAPDTEDEARFQLAVGSGVHEPAHA